MLIRIILFLLIQFISFVFLLDLKAQFPLQKQNPIDSLINLAKQQTGIEKITTLEKIFDAQYYASPKEASKTADQILKLSEQMDSKKVKAKVAMIQTLKYLDIVKKHDSTVFWSNKALSYLEPAKDSFNILQVYRYLATSHYYKDYFDSATYFYIKSTKIAEALNNEKELIKSYGSLANVYNISNDTKTAQFYRKKAYNLAKKNKNAEQQIKLAFNLSSSYLLEKELDSAIFYAKEAVSLSEQINFQVGLYRSLTKLAECYYEKQEGTKALQSIERVMSMPKEVKDPRYNAHVLYNYSKILMLNKLHREARENVYNTFTFLEVEGKRVSSEINREKNYNLLSIIYAHLNQPDSAEFYIRKFIELAKETEHNRIMDKTSEFQTKYETEKKEQEIIKLSQEAKIKDLELRNSYYFTIGAIILGFVILISVWIFFKQKNIIDTFEKEQAKLRWRRAQLNPHFFFNVLSAIQTLLYEQQNEKAKEYVSGFSLLMRQVLEESNKELVSLEEEIKFLNTYLALEQLSLNFEFELTCSPEGLETEDIFVPTMLLQPFVENAIEHGLHKSTKEEKKLEIKFIEIDQHTLQVSVKDNGAGRNDERKKQHISRALEITQDRKKLMKDAFDYQIIDHKDEANNSLGTEVIFTVKI